MKRTNLITEDILRDIDKINRMCHKMHVPAPPVNFITIEVLDKDGKVIEEYKTKANSWVRNAYNFLAQQFLPCDNYQGSATFGAGSQAIKNTGGTTLRVAGTYMAPGNDYNMAAYAYDSAGAASNFGILVGSSNAAESFEANNLTSKIAHGTAAGQLYYNAMALPTAVYDAGTRKWTGTAVRLFNNSSGADITVNEVGYAIYCYVTTSTRQYVLLSRDVLASPIVVPNSGQIRVTYTSEITYPA